VIGAVVLAAGEARRFGSPKQLALLEGRPLLEHTVSAVCDVPAITRVVVVLGARADVIETGVQFGRAETVRCPRWREGMAASLRAGADALQGSGLETLVVAVGDQPRLSSKTIEHLLDLSGDAVRASYSGAPGHPVVMRGTVLARLLESDLDIAGRSLVEGATLVEISDRRSGADVDTPADLAALTSTQP
jgi:CTP:molybdopterin cytidylyltransferase MocA